MLPRHFFALGWIFVGAVCGVLAVTLAWAFAVAALGCFALGLAIERRWIGIHDARISGDSLARRLPFVVRSPIARKPSLHPRPVGEMGTLDFEAAAEQAMASQSAILTRMTREQGAMSKLVGRYTPKFAAAAAASGARKLQLSREFASKIAPHVERLESDEALFRVAAHDLKDNYLARVKAADYESAATHRETLDQFRTAVRECQASVKSFAKAVVASRAVNLQRDLNRTWDRLLEILNRLLDDFDLLVGVADDVLKEIALKERLSRQSSSTAVASRDKT